MLCTFGRIAMSLDELTGQAQGTILTALQLLFALNRVSD